MFPFSLIGKAKQWYTFAIESTNGDWDELKDKFCPTFFPMSHISTLPRAILDFEQYEKEFIGAAWARFSKLIYAGPHLPLPDGVLLRHFCLGLDINADLCLDVTTGGRFTHKPLTEQVKFHENFLKRHASFVMETRTLQAKVTSSIHYKVLP